jgi:hypothetical protein
VRYPVSRLTKRFQPSAEPQQTDIAGIEDLRPLPEMSYDEYDAADESDNSLDFGGAEGKPPNSMK